MNIIGKLGKVCMYAWCNHTNIIDVRLSVMEGQQKRFDLEIQEAVSLAMEHRKLEIHDLCEQP